LQLPREQLAVMVGVGGPGAVGDHELERGDAIRVRQLVSAERAREREQLIAIGGDRAARWLHSDRTSGSVHGLRDALESARDLLAGRGAAKLPGSRCEQLG
jgi:hypothetical protein